MQNEKIIPIELLRAVVAVSDNGSYTKAAKALNLTQPAISAQIARLGQLLGGSMFAKGSGITPTKRGIVALRYARRMLAMNSQLLALAGPNSAQHQLVIGLPSCMGYQNLISIFERCSDEQTDQRVTFRCDHVQTLVGDLNLGSIDIAYLCNAIDPPGIAITEWLERMVWVKSPKLILDDRVPIPLVGWPGTYSNQLAVEKLQKSSLSFFFSFAAPDFAARRAAVAAGLGVLPMPARIMTPDMEIIRAGLPELPDIKMGVFARDGLDLRSVRMLVHRLTEALAPGPSNRLRDFAEQARLESQMQFERRRTKAVN